MIFRFAHPAALLLLFAPLIALAVIRWTGFRSAVPTLLYSDTRLVQGQPPSWRLRLRRLPDVLRFLVWLLLVIALARPQSGQAQDIIRGQGIDMVLALDISGSMSALDFEPQNRLQTAQSVISRFIAGREFDRIGLVVFAEDAFQVTPPTLDYPALSRALNSLRLAADLGLPDGTAIGMGLASAANMLRQSTAASKVIILLTDGANNAGGLGPVTAAELVSALGIRVYTIGMGKTGLVSMPDADGRIQTVKSDLDEPTLQAIASTTGGRYFRAQDLGDLQRIYDEINILERSEVERQIFVRWQDQSFALLWLALGLLIGERLLRHTVFQSLP